MPARRNRKNNSVDLQLKDRTALVLGAGGGLGGAIARTLAREGAKVVVADVDPQAAGRTLSAIEAEGGRALALQWDLADLGSIDGHVSTIERELGAVDVLVNNTGGPPPTPASGQDPALWTRHFQAMVLSVISVTDRVLPQMRSNKWGRIVTSTSSGVIAPIPNLGISNALRLSLVGWSKTLAREVGRDGITANIVLPGRIATPRITFLDEQKAAREKRALDEVVSESTASIPLGRYGDPQEYADVVTFLASARASYLTGSVIRVDGGMIQSI
jgi:3-oxoacyl-[acyl-carrier protein] reductase